MTATHANTTAPYPARLGRCLGRGVLALLLLANVGCVCGVRPRIAPRDYVFHQTDWRPLCPMTVDGALEVLQPDSYSSPEEAVPRPMPEPSPPRRPAATSMNLPAAPKLDYPEPLGLLVYEEPPKDDPTVASAEPKPIDRSSGEPGLSQPLGQDAPLLLERTPGPLARTPSATAQASWPKN